MAIIKKPSVAQLKEMLGNENNISQNWYTEKTIPCKKRKCMLGAVHELYKAHSLSEHEIDPDINILELYCLSNNKAYDTLSASDLREFNSIVREIETKDTRVTHFYALISDTSQSKLFVCVFALVSETLQLYINEYRLTLSEEDASSFNRIDISELADVRQAATDECDRQMTDPRISKLFNDYIPEVKEIIKQHLRDAPCNNEYFIYIPRRDIPEWGDISMQTFSLYLWHITFCGNTQNTKLHALSSINYDQKVDMVVIQLNFTNGVMRSLSASR